VAADAAVSACETDVFGEFHFWSFQGTMGDCEDGLFMLCDKEFFSNVLCLGLKQFYRLSDIEHISG
jgi:hypothetical protein